MKKSIYAIITIALTFILFICSCSIKTDNLEDSVIYTTVYPINYLAKYIYKDYAEINSIYPINCDLNSYKLTNKKKDQFAKADLFIYNGLTDEKEIAKDLINRNGDLLIIDVSKGLSIENDPTELWLSPNNYLMLAKNIKNNLSEYLTSKYIIESLEKNFADFQEKISIIDASLHTVGKTAAEKNKNTIIVSNNTFKYLEKYDFRVISLQDEKNLKEAKLNAIKNGFSSGKYTFILTTDFDKDNEIVNDLVNNHKAKTIMVDTLTYSLTDDYFDIMTEYIENIKKIVS